MGKTLSVSIAAYNVEKYIKQALDSFLASNVLDDLEVIVVNDGSKDATSSIVREYVDKYPETFILVEKENGGWGSTVNKGMEVATGKYFKLLDGDDWFYTENLSEYIDLLKNSDADLVITPFGNYDDETDEIYAVTEFPLECKKIYEFESIAKDFKLKMHAMTVNMDIIRKSNMRILDHCFYTDAQFMIELSSYFSDTVYYDKPIYCYRLGRGGQSVSIEGYLKHHDDHRRVIEYLINLYSQKNLSKNIDAMWLDWINTLASQQYYIYMCMDKDIRMEYIRKWDSFLKKNNVPVPNASAEVNIARMFKFKGISQVHFVFELIRKIAKRFGVDLYNG